MGGKYAIVPGNNGLTNEEVARRIAAKLKIAEEDAAAATDMGKAKANYSAQTPKDSITGHEFKASAMGHTMKANALREEAGIPVPQYKNVPQQKTVPNDNVEGGHLFNKVGRALMRMKLFGN